PGGRGIESLAAPPLAGRESWYLLRQLHNFKSGARGERLFVTCGACHGARAEGNQALDAPALAGLPAWYLARQLRKFHSGVRGRNPQDVPGARMQAAAAVLASDADVT